MRLLGRCAECEALDELIADVLAGTSRVMVLRGEAGVGKSALLGYLYDRVAGWRVARAVGVESEMELAYSGLHQLCAPMLDHLEQLPVPQGDALATVFGRSTGPPPDRFLVGLAVLSLFAEVAEQQPLICIVDDAQWLDRASAQALAFVARRLLAEQVALLCAARTGIGDDVLTELPELSVCGLGDSDARALLLDNVYGPLDPAVCDQIVAESHGNPLALLELPRTWSAADLAGGFGLLDSQPVAGKIEQSYARRLRQLPSNTQLLVLAAAAEPLGDPLLLHRAAETLGVHMEAGDPAVGAGLLRLDGRVEFAHPLVRSAAYRAAGADERRHVHRALADATDAEIDPDRRAWHRAHATPEPDEEVADELVRSAGRAEARGGLAAAAAFLEHAVALTLNPVRRAARALLAAHAMHRAGEQDSARELLRIAEAGPLDELGQAQAQQLAAQIIVAQRRDPDNPLLLLAAARRLEPLDAELARAAYIEAFVEALEFARPETARAVGVAVQNVLPTEPRHPVELLLVGWAQFAVDGFPAGAELLKRAVDDFARTTMPREEELRWLPLVCRVAFAHWDDERWDTLSARYVQLTREVGALSRLPDALTLRSYFLLAMGDLDSAAELINEADSISRATHSARTAAFSYIPAALLGLRESEPEARAVNDTLRREAAQEGDMETVVASELNSAKLELSVGRYEDALAAAQRAYEHRPTGFVLPDLIEAAVRSGDRAAAVTALGFLRERIQIAGTDYGLGMEARARALLGDRSEAQSLYAEAIERLGRTRARIELARAHLLYGEWLRRENRRLNAREQLRTAHDMFAAIGATSFMERTAHELLATGERARKRTDDTRADLTAQEAQIARLASEGLTNPEIGTQLFLSARTVEWHLRKVFAKLGISSRRQLRTALRSAHVLAQAYSSGVGRSNRTAVASSASTSSTRRHAPPARSNG